MHQPDLSSLPLDPFWTSIGELDTHAAFEAIADAVAFRREVPADIAGRFDLVRAAVRHAAVDAVLVDAAFARALLTLELALTRRHEELGSPLPKKNRSLAGLIEWGGTVPLFEGGPEPVHGARRLRNSLVAHPRSDARAFYHVLQVVREIPPLINGLYEDSGLRRRRLDAWTGLREALGDITRDGAVLDATALGLGRHLIYAAACPYAENRSGPLHARALAWPIFDPPDPEEAAHIPPPIAFDASSWALENDTLTLVLRDSGGQVTIGPIRKPANASRFAAWTDALAKGQADVEVLRSMASHHAGQVRRSHRDGETPPGGRVVVERVAVAPLGLPQNSA